MLNRIIYSFLFSFFLSSSLLFAAPEFSFQNYTVEDGLSFNTVYWIEQDDEGFIWLATQSGLNRFDGEHFKVFTHNPDSPNSLSSHNLNSIVKDKHGNLWLGSWGGGLNKLDPRKETFTRYQHDPNNPNSLADDTIQNLHMDQKGIIWIATRKGGVNSFNPETGTFKRYPFDGKAPNALSNVNVYAITSDHEGNIWISTREGLNKLNPVTGHFTHFFHEPGNSHSLPNNQVRFVYEDSKKRLWVGTEDGLSIYNRKNNHFKRYSTDAFPAPTQKINHIFEDQNNRIWVSGDQGVYLLNESETKFDRYDLLNNPQNTWWDTRAIYHNKEGNLFIGTRNAGLFVTRFKPVKKTVFPKLDTYLHANNYFKQVRLARLYQKSIYLLLKDRLIEFDTNTEDIHEYICTECLDSNSPQIVLADIRHIDDEGVFISGSQKDVTLFNTKTKTFNHHYSKLQSQVKEPVNRIHFGRQNKEIYFTFKDDKTGYYIYHRDTKTWEVLRHNPENPHSVMENFGSGVVELSKNEIGFISRGGISIQNRETKLFTHLSRNKHFHSFESYGLKKIDNSIYAATAGAGVGIIKNLKNKKVDFVKSHPVLLQSEVYYLYQDNEKFLYTSILDGHQFIKSDVAYTQQDLYEASDGIYKIRNEGHFDQDKLISQSSTRIELVDLKDLPIRRYRFPIVVSELTVNGESLPKSKLNSPEKVIQLDYDENYLSFQIALLNYFRPEKNEYYYRLKGLEKNWNKNGTRNFFNYTNLPGGLYELQVKVRNSKGLWNETQLHLPIHIATPPWKTWWAIILYILAILAGFFAYLKFRLKAQEKKAAEQQKVIVKLKEVDRIKDDLLANTSHELRTPLNGIIGLGSHLIDDFGNQLPNQALANLKTIVDCGNRLNHQVNDLLDMSVLKTGKLDLEQAPLSLFQITQKTLSILQPLADQKSIVLKNEIPSELPPVMADEHRTIQILQNLIGNAIKFTNSGTIRIAGEQANDMVKISVIDTGKGIPEEKLAGIFEPFEQVESSGNRKSGGAGLGLSISKSLVEQQGGEITVTSEPGEGSCFVFSLPITSHTAVNREIVIGESTPNTVDNQVFQSDSASQKGDFDKTILIIDDDPVNLQVIKNQLQHNYRLIQANSGWDALSKVESESVNLILLDLMMPEMDGFEVCKEIRSQYNQIELPVIVLTARYQKEDIARCFDIGANDYLTKPFVKQELIARIEAQLNQQKLIEEKEQLHQELDLIQQEKEQLNNENDFRETIVKAMNHCLEVWEKETGKTKFDLAEESAIWAVHIDKGVLYTRTMDKYLSLKRMPKHPRWRDVLKTIDFVSVEMKNRGVDIVSLEKHGLSIRTMKAM
jgi:signal transduction histidine kinase/DNA-binding response OmpR family regulator/ligand-binding sensor domain-containing protein